MTVSVVQTLSRQQVYSQSFGAAITPGNSVLVALSGFTTAGAALSAAPPTINGAAVTGATLLGSVQSAGGNAVYAAVWLLPAVTGGVVGPVASVVTNAGSATAIGITAWEFAGLGATPSADIVVSGNGTSGTALSSGTSGATVGAPEVIVAIAVSFGNAVAKVNAPWIEIGTSGGADSQAGYQIATSAGGTFSYAPTAAGSAGWASLVVSVQGSGGGTPSFTGASTATVAFAGTAAGSKRASGASTATVAMAATAAGAKRASGSSMATVAFGASVAGAKRAAGAVAASVAFAASAVGSVGGQAAQAVASVAFTASAVGAKSVAVAVAATVNLGASALGTKRVARAVQAIVGFFASASTPVGVASLDELRLSATMTGDLRSATITGNQLSATITRRDYSGSIG